MVYKIVHSSLAEKTFLQNIKYLEEDWTIKELKNFIIKTSEIVDLLKMDPHIFPKWEFDPSIRKVILLKQITLFYTINVDIVEIHLFWNNYKNPEDLKVLLK
jgi:hypothetical protein